MSKKIKATEDGVSLFNAIAIGLGFEILKNNVSKDSPGSKRLLEEFANHHPQFIPQTWETLVQWLSFYNNTKDLELILAPVLFKLIQKYKQDLETQILDELTNLVWKNKERIEKEEQWYKLSSIEGSVALFPHIDNLPMSDRAALLKQLKELLKEHAGGLSRDEFRNFLATNSKAKDLLDSLKAKINSDKNASQRAYNIAELKGMTDALSLTLIEDNQGIAAAQGTKIYLSRKAGFWEVTCADDVEGVLNTNPQMLKVSLYQAIEPNAPQVVPPTPAQLELMKQPRVMITQQIVDNPGLGNCAFYAYAIGMINIIQEEKVAGNETKFAQWVSLDGKLANEYDAICAFDYNKPDNALLNRLQRSLRNTGYDYQVNEIKQACIKATVVVDNFKDLYPDATSKAHKDAMKRKYKDITANSNYINFAAMYYGVQQDIGAGFNPFVDSAAIRKAMRELDRSKIEDNYEELVLVPLFLKLVYGEEQGVKQITQATVPAASSPILAAINNITQEFFWGTHQDLTYLATMLEVNLHTLENGQDRRRDSLGDIPERHTITVNNQGNFHWTTQINEAQEINAKDKSGKNKKDKTDLKSSLKPVKHPEEEKTELGKEASKVVTPAPAPATATATATVPVVPVPEVLMPGQVETVGIPSKPMDDKPQHKEVHFTFTTSQLAAQEKHAQLEAQEKLAQLEAQEKHGLKVAKGETQKPKLSPAPKVESRDTDSQLAHLRRAVANATLKYTNYSESIWFSLFHRHGNAGRVRAKDFNTRFAAIQNFDEAKKELIAYLRNDQNNGNTHPHSYRTMLLHEMLKDNATLSLQNTSKKFDELLTQLSSALKVSAGSFSPDL